MSLRVPVRVCFHGAPHLLDMLADMTRVHAALAGARVKEVGRVQGALDVGRVEDHFWASGLARGAWPNVEGWACWKCV